MQAVRLAGAEGDLAGGENVLWSHGRGTSYVPSPLLYGDYLYFVRRNSGVLSCLDAATGEVLYEGKRLGLKTLYASPVAAAGRIYFTSREGRTKVIAHDEEFEEIATNELDDEFDASPVVIGKELYLRGRKHLYSIAQSSN